MTADWVRTGAVFRWERSETPSRVLLRDGDTLMYDAWWSHLQDWGMADLAELRRGRCHYYVTAVAAALEKAAYVGASPLSEEEERLHRPDLPFAVATSATTTWTAPAVAGPAAAQVLPVGEVYVSPFGPKGGGNLRSGSAPTTARRSRSGNCWGRRPPSRFPTWGNARRSTASACTGWGCSGGSPRTTSGAPRPCTSRKADGPAHRPACGGRRRVKSCEAWGHARSTGVPDG